MSRICWGYVPACPVVIPHLFNSIRGDQISGYGGTLVLLKVPPVQVRYENTVYKETAAKLLINMLNLKDYFIGRQEIVGRYLRGTLNFRVCVGGGGREYCTAL